MFTLLKFLLPALLAFGAGLYAAHRWDAGEIAALKLADAKSASLALDTRLRVIEAQDAVSIRAAVNEARSQQKLADAKNRIPNEVRRHVPSLAQPCIPLGLVRVLDAAALDTDPDSLSLPAGQSDATCAPVDAARLAASVAGNYAVARQNAEQLNALEAWVAAESRSAPDPSRAK